MRDYGRILKHIVPTYLLIALFAALIAQSLRWLDRSVVGLNLDEIVYAVAIPIAVCLMGTWWFLRPRMRVVDMRAKHLEPDNDDPEERRATVTLFAALLAVLPALVVGIEAPELTAKLHVVERVSEIDPEAPNRYYMLEAFAIDQDTLGLSYTNEMIDGPGDSRLLSLYFATRLDDWDGNRGETPARYWYARKFTREIQGNLGQNSELLSDFIDASEAAFWDHDFGTDRYFKVLKPDAFDAGQFADAARNSGRPFQEPLVILEPGVGEFEDRDRFPDRDAQFYAIAIPVLAILLLSFPGLLAFGSLNEAEYERQIGSGPSIRDLGSEAASEPLPGLMDTILGELDLFRFEGRFMAGAYIGLALVVSYVVLGLLGMPWSEPTFADLIEWGGNRRAETTGGEWWRLLSSVFVHAGGSHLMISLIGLITVSLFIEPFYGRALFFAAFVLSGIAGSIVSVIWYPDVISVGATGAIFGLYGLMLALSLKGLFPIGIFFGLSLYLAVCVVAAFMTEVFLNAMHLGGFVCGLIMGLAYRISPELLEELTGGADGEEHGTDD